MDNTEREFEPMCCIRPAPPLEEPPLSEHHTMKEDTRQNNKEAAESYQFKVGTSGGILAIPGEDISLVIPPDAVPLNDQSDFIITIGIHRDMTSDFEAETGSIALSPTVTLEPHGLVFRKPVYLFLPSYAVPRLSKLPDTKLVCR